MVAISFLMLIMVVKGIVTIMMVVKKVERLMVAITDADIGASGDDAN